VLKFGGAAVSSPERFATIASVILDRAKEFPRVAVVVSAMGDTTDELLALARRVNPNPPRRELDMLISVGERISIALLAMAIEAKGKEAVSFTGSQSGILTSVNHTDARIVSVKPHRLLPHLDAGRIVIVAGFQGMSTGGDITTLGRGGSDTSAVALGVALGAERIEFFKDVPGVFDCDPRENPAAKLIRDMPYDQALAIIKNSGHQVLQSRSIELAERNQMPLHILPFENHRDPEVGTWIGLRTRPAEPPAPQFENA
jgi:aspartate kinase